MAQTGELPEHPVAQGGTQRCGSKVTDVSPVKALFSESDANHHLFIVYVKQHLQNKHMIRKLIIKAINAQMYYINRINSSQTNMQV